jgi:hypothetical protein
LYAPAANFAGIDSFTYTVSDGNGGTATASVTVTVSAVDDVPIAADDLATGPEDAVLVVDVVANDRDPDGTAVHVQSVTQPAHGSVTVLTDGAAAGSIRYTPAADFAGTDRFTYTAADGAGESAPATVTVSITALNDQPTASDDSGSTTEDTSVSIQAVANDADPDGDALTVTGVGAPAHGTAAANAGQVAYTPAANFAGTDSFTYTVSDGNGASATATINVTVSSVDDAPVAADDTATTPEDTAVVIQAVANDTDADGDALTVTSVGAPAHGTAVAAAGSVRYTPAANFAGTDTFTYVVTDGNGGSATATITVTVDAVNDAPTAVDDSGTTAEDTPLVVDALANDADPDGDALTVTSVSAPSHGTAAVVDGRQVTYTPAANFAGSDTFAYTIADGRGGTATATMTVMIAAVDDAPVAVADVAAGAEDTIVVIDVVGNDHDPDGTSVRVTAVTQPAHGSVSVITEGVHAGWVSYAPATNFSGTDTFTYSITGGGRASATAAVSVSIAGLNDEPTAVGDSATTAEDTSLVIDVIANDADADDDALTVTGVSAPAHGTATVTAGQVTYAPAANFSGLDTFTYTATDGNGGTATATVTVTVTAVDDGPVAADDTVTGPEDAAIVVDVTANDADEDGDSLRVTTVSAPAHGTVAVLDGAHAGKLSYTPAPNFSGTDTFRYTVTDGTGSATAVVTVIVTALNDAPVAGGDAITTTEDVPVVIEALANDSDPDGDPLSIAEVGAPAFGTASIVATGGGATQIAYTPNSNFSGTDRFSYTIADSNGGVAVGTIDVTVAEANDAPVAVDDVATVSVEGGPVAIDVLGNDSTAPDSGETLTILAVGPALNGTLAIEGSTIVYTPTAALTGSDTFTYTIGDGQGGTATASVIVTVAVP